MAEEQVDEPGAGHFHLLDDSFRADPTGDRLRNLARGTPGLRRENQREVRRPVAVLLELGLVQLRVRDSGWVDADLRGGRRGRLGQDAGEGLLDHGRQSCEY